MLTKASFLEPSGIKNCYLRNKCFLGAPAGCKLPCGRWNRTVSRRKLLMLRLSSMGSSVVGRESWRAPASEQPRATFFGGQVKSMRPATFLTYFWEWVDTDGSTVIDSGLGRIKGNRSLVSTRHPVDKEPSHSERLSFFKTHLMWFRVRRKEFDDWP